jgi:hypothetical protein
MLMLGQQVLHPLVVGGIDNGFNDGFIGTRTNQFLICSLAQHYTQRPNQNRFSCTCLTCDDIQTASKFNRQLIDECKIFDVERLQHSFIEKLTKFKVALT